MINNIITGISQKLDESFNLQEEKYNIYTDGVEQGLEEPCFFIFSLSPNQRQVSSNRYYREYSFDIQYFPSTTEINFELNEMVERLYQYMEYIMVNGELIRGTKMNAEIVNNVLHFFVNYNMYVTREVIKEESMEEILFN